ncbi:hypothetical protein [Amycolatopsis sp. WGS_07]|uniref:hypothetical protein n=1 Tax=Amycolatopsis sp. WGS_07 TaxID=3076764 RepID=UPI003872D237
MGGISVYVLQSGSDLTAAFEAARQAAAAKVGWRPDSGTIATKQDVTAVRTDAMPIGPARLLAGQLLDRMDARYCDHYDVQAAAIPICDTYGGTVTAWLLFAMACD